MASDTSEQPVRPPWAPVGDGEENSSPASAALTPQAIDVDDADIDIIRPVASPPVEETFPNSGGFPSVDVTPYSSVDPAPGFSDDEDSPPAADTDPVRALGQSAVTNATFSAAGAHTPMGGVPLPRATFLPSPAEAPDGPSPFADVNGANDDFPFVPTFASREHSPTASQPTISFAAPLPTEPTEPVDDAPPHHARGGHEGEPWWRSVGALVAYGVAVMAGLAYGLVAVLGATAPPSLPAEVLLEGPPDNGIAPIELTEPTAFLAGAPLKTPTHTLTEAQSYGLGELDDLPGRTAEVHDLTYFDGDTTFVVRAYQHFNADDAVATFGTITADAPQLSPIEISGEHVGDRAELTTDAGLVIAWRNGTAVFVLSGPEDGIREFFMLFGW
jgi:hypothetical protein